MVISKILLPTDGSDNAQKTTEYAIQFAQIHQASITVVYVYGMVSVWRRGAGLAESLKSSLEEEATALVGDVASKIQAAGLPVSMLVVEGSPAEGILKAIDAETPDLVIMGSRGAGGLPGLPLGSVAERVVRHSPTPVLVVK